MTVKLSTRRYICGVALSPASALKSLPFPTCPFCKCLLDSRLSSSPALALQRRATFCLLNGLCRAFLFWAMDFKTRHFVTEISNAFGGSEMAVVAAGVGGSCLLSPHLTNLTAGTLCMQHPSLMFASSEGLNKLNNALDRESQKCVEFCGPLPSCMHPIERGPRPRWRMRPF